MGQSCNSPASTFSQRRGGEDTLILKMLTDCCGNKPSPPLHGHAEQEQQAGSSSTPGSAEMPF